MALAVVATAIAQTKTRVRYDGSYRRVPNLQTFFERAGRTPMIVHNIGRGPEVEDILFKYSITEHHRYGLVP